MQRLYYNSLLLSARNSLLHERRDFSIVVDKTVFKVYASSVIKVYLETVYCILDYIKIDNNINVIKISKCKYQC